jgi:hypothetical protein
MSLRSVSDDQAFLDEIGTAIDATIANWKDQLPPTSVIALLVDREHGHCLLVSDLTTESIMHALQAAYTTVACQPMPANDGEAS